VSGDVLAMSAKERDRAAVIRRVVAGELAQARAAELLWLGVRQVKRLAARQRAAGDAGLISAKRGKPSNNRLAADKRQRIEAALTERYPDFGATLAAEKLAEHEGITVSVETVRQLQIGLKLWRPKSRAKRRVFQSRQRRPRFGELIQIDGSPHAWLEGRGPRATLLVFIDDATGRLTDLRFVPAETTKGYLEALRSHILAHGVPLALYSDRHGIFRVNAKDVDRGDGLTAFGRVTERLRIEQICARTPQAKGRVERANQTLQDRLVKELRLAGINDLAAAAQFLPEFMIRYNARFAVVPAEGEDAHRPWASGCEALDAALAAHEDRVLSKALTFRFESAMYCVKTKGPGMALRGATVTVRRYLDGRVDAIRKGKLLELTTVRGLPSAAAVADEKTLDAHLDTVIARGPRSPDRECAPGHGRPARYGAV
jgi:transposase